MAVHSSSQVSWVTQAGQVINRKLDPHINYNITPGTQAEADSAVGTPTGIAFSGDGLRAYVTSLATQIRAARQQHCWRAGRIG